MWKSLTFGSAFQTFGAATQNEAVSVHVHGTDRRGVSVDRRHRMVTRRCRSWSMYAGGTEVDRALFVMTTILCCMWASKS